LEQNRAKLGSTTWETVEVDCSESTVIRHIIPAEGSTEDILISELEPNTTKDDQREVGVSLYQTGKKIKVPKS
jgi:hypothetical protein